MRIYLKILAGFYIVGAALHLLDVFGLRLQFSELSRVWQVWIVYLLIFDLLVAIGLWRSQTWGIAVFLIVAISQLIAYLGFQEIFGEQQFLIAFHLATVSIFLGLWCKSRKTRSVE